MLPLFKGGRFVVSLSRSSGFWYYSKRALETAVLSFGDSSNGALGLPSSLAGEDAYEPTQIPDLPSDISGISAGHYHSLAVTAQGEVWAWGRNEEYQLGRGVFDPRGSWNQPKRVEGLDQVRGKAVFASGVVSTAIGDDGSLWVWGKSKRGQLGLGEGVTEAIVPSRVEALAREEIVKVSLGWGHSLALTRDGKLFGWGYSAEGRLGQIGDSLEVSSAISGSNISRITGNSGSEVLELAEKMVSEKLEREKNMPNIWEPCLVKELQGLKVSDVACGLDHSLVLCCDGTLWSCGNNTYGQLGRVSGGTKMLPVDMSTQPLSLAAGLGHSLAVCKIPSLQNAGEASGIMSWGWNWNSQLGRDGEENLPGMVEGLNGEIPVSVSCGRAHSLALTSKREIWVWGCGKNGRLGLGSSSDEPEPTLLDSLSGFEVLQVAAGLDHNLLLATI